MLVKKNLVNINQHHHFWHFSHRLKINIRNARNANIFKRKKIKKIILYKKFRKKSSTSHRLISSFLISHTYLREMPENMLVDAMLRTFFS